MDAQSLFPPLIETSEVTESRGGPFAGVALEQGIDRVLDYSVPRRLVPLLKIGQRVRVPLGRGNKITDGYVVSINPTTQYPKIKPLADLKDERVLVAPKLMTLARWMSRYYVTPLGIVLESVIPSAVKKRIGIGYLQIVTAAQSPDALQAVLEKIKAPKRRAVLARLLQLEPGAGIELVRLAGEAGTTAVTVRKLARLGLITITQQVDLPRFTDDSAAAVAKEQDILFNEDQQKIFDELRPRIERGGFSVNLLHGVTGSGKTEIYLQCIRRVIEMGRQAIVLVPEIALTPQTVKRFTARFPRVAILHSGLTATERHRYWQRISQGEADVVVGARSAVFSPMPNLGMIVVDEEHDASYKQDTAPRYQARDVAVKRAQLEGIPILLGSATPSLETYWRVKGTKGEGAEAPYHFLTLPSRVRGLQMPRVEVIDMRLERRLRRGVHLLSKRLEHMLQTTIASGQQAILLLNRRGYSNFVYCASCDNVIQCKYCDTTMTYHRSAASEVHNARFDSALHSGQLNCHYCLATTKLPDKCPTCGKKLSLFGLGTQRVEEELIRKFPDLKFARVDSDSMHSAKDYEALLGRFAKGEIQVLLGTQMIAKGLDYPNVTLVGVISGDTALSLPDFRAAERTFQLITQVAGRAGRGDAAGRVVLQTFLPDDPSIQLAIKQDFINFAGTELKHRREVGLPPFTRMARIILRDEDQEKLHKTSEELAAAVKEGVSQLEEEVRVQGPMPCAINRIAGYFRNQIVLTAPRSNPLQQLLARLREVGALSKTDRIAVDVDPVSLL
jgi:primosomal protein N' (replication factor Y) (superfamily II helicase)